MREKKIFIDLIISVKEVEKSVKNAIDNINQSHSAYKSQILYLNYITLADCKQVINELDNYITNFDYGNIEQDKIISMKTDKTLDVMMKRQEMIAKILEKEFNETMKTLYEMLGNDN